MTKSNFFGILLKKDATDETESNFDSPCSISCIGPDFGILLTYSDFHFWHSLAFGITPSLYSLMQYNEKNYKFVQGCDVLKPKNDFINKMYFLKIRFCWRVNFLLSAFTMRLIGIVRVPVIGMLLIKVCNESEHDLKYWQMVVFRALLVTQSTA